MCKYGIKTGITVSECARQSPSGSAAMPRPNCSAFSVFPSVSVARRALGFGARERSERVTVRRQPRRQLCRRLVYTSTRKSAKRKIGPFLTLIDLFVVIGIIYSFHKSFSVGNFVRQRVIQQFFYFRAVDYAAFHGVEIIVFVDHAPINASG